MKKFSFCLLFGSLIYVFYGCNDNSGGDSIDCTGIVATYSTLSPLLNGTCATMGCHDAVTVAGNADFSSYAGSKSYLSKSNNKFLCSINWESGCSTMPQGLNKMDAVDIKRLTCWYNNGFPQ